jgi:hypothetical protein
MSEGARDDASAERARRVGLCARCRNARRILSSKGSEFWMCELSKTDARFAKYPPLPVLRCEGFQRNTPTR